MNGDTGLCKGCYRTLEEISNWISYTDKERLEIVSNLKKRVRDFQP